MSEENFEVLHENQPYGIKLWKVLAAFCLVIVLLCTTSLVLCISEDQCRNNIPTINNMLNSTFTTPYVISGMNSALGLHMILVFALYSLTQVHSIMWSWMQLFTALLVYTSLILTLLVFPFTKWENNWAEVSVIVTLTVWMVVVMTSLYRYYGRKLDRKRKYLRINVGLFVLYVVCSLIYIILRSIGSMGIVPRDDGLLVVQLIGGLSIFGFMLICMIHVSHMTIQMS